jgi:hypothetical protein
VRDAKAVEINPRRVRSSTGGNLHTDQSLGECQNSALEDGKLLKELLIDMGDRVSDLLNQYFAVDL